MTSYVMEHHQRNAAGNGKIVTYLTDHFQLPSTIPIGSYSVTMRIIDPDNYYEPLMLAIQGRNTDGSYSLGTVIIITFGVS